MNYSCGVILLLAGMLSCGRNQPAPTQPPIYSDRSILPGQSYQYAPLAPGKIMSVYGDHLGPPAACFGLANTKQTESPNPARPNQTPIEIQIYPRLLCETEVRVGGIPAGLLYVQARQINFKVPQEVAIEGATTVQVIHNGRPGPAVTQALSAR